MCWGSWCCGRTESPRSRTLSRRERVGMRGFAGRPLFSPPEYAPCLDYLATGLGSFDSLILYQATYSAGRNSKVSKVAEMMPPIMA